MRRKLLILLALLIVVAAGAGAYDWYLHTRTPAAADPSLLTPVGADDHILGNPAAPVMILEYCDIDSPFCKQFQKVLEEVIAVHGASGEVAWTYRHLPVVEQHPNSEREAEAAECAGAAGGTTAFFAFIDAIQAAAPGAAQFDPSGYGAAASSLGLDESALSRCLSAHTYAARVAGEANNALAAGAGGVPYTVIFARGLAPIPIAGALSYAEFDAVIEAAITRTQAAS